MRHRKLTGFRTYSKNRPVFNIYSIVVTSTKIAKCFGILLNIDVTARYRISVVGDFVCDLVEK